MKPTVRIECEDCPWRHEVPDEDIVIEGGIPRARSIPEHDCPGGASLLERASFDVELVTSAPVYNCKIVL